MTSVVVGGVYIRRGSRILVVEALGSSCVVCRFDSFSFHRANLKLPVEGISYSIVHGSTITCDPFIVSSHRLGDYLGQLPEKFVRQVKDEAIKEALRSDRHR